MKLILYGFVITFLCSCSFNNSSTVPDGIINRDSLVIILADMEIVEAAFQKKMLKGNLIKLGKDQYQIIFNKYNIDKNKLQNSLIYYEKAPENLEKIFDDVISHLSKKQIELEK